MKYLTCLLALLLTFSFNAQNIKNNEDDSSIKEIQEVTNTSDNFDTFVPEENGRPTQFLTRYLRNHNRLNLDRNIKNILLKPNVYSDSEFALREPLKFGNGTTSVTNIFYDGNQIFGEGINRLYVIEFIRTDAIHSISRSSIGYDKIIQIFSKKYIKNLE